MEVIEYMAKLSGVTLLPAVAERIQYEGKTYVAADKGAEPKAGDIVRANKDGYIDITPGEFYPVKIGNNGWYFADDANDARDFDYKYAWRVNRADFTVFTPEADADTIVYEGVTYRKVARKAIVGEKVLIVNPHTLTYYDADEVKDVLRLITTENWPVIKDSKGSGNSLLYHSEYVVLEPVTAADRLKVGDYVRITEDQNSFPVGTIVKVTETDAYRDGLGVIRATDGKSTRLSDKFEPVTSTEAEAARKEADESAKWSAIGRKPGEYRKGDIVCGIGRVSVNKGRKVTGTVKDLDIGSNPKGNLGILTFDNDYVSIDVTELVAPVESVFANGGN